VRLERQPLEPLQPLAAAVAAHPQWVALQAPQSQQVATLAALQQHFRALVAQLVVASWRASRLAQEASR
jgi:uncharacterized protein YdaL